MKELPATSLYGRLLEKIFKDRFKAGMTEVAFLRTDLVETAKQLGLELPKNLGDVVYSVRYRTALPNAIVKTQPKGKKWIIEGSGTAKYVFRLSSAVPIRPNPALAAIKIPDATPEIIAANAQSDEQALLAKVRYNRLIDIFLGITAYSLQNHLRTTVKGVGGIEIDEMYIGLDKHGRQYVLPVQAKRGNDQLSVVQTRQDMLCCAEKYPTLLCRPISAQFMAANVIALFELTLDKNEIRIVEERQYTLVPASEITDEDLRTYAKRG